MPVKSITFVPRIVPVLILLCFLALCSLALSGCSNNGEPAEPLSESEQLLRDGQRQARMCLGCHGPRGVSRVASYPSLAGLSEEYLAEQLRAYRSRERPDPTMTSIARNLSDEDIAALSYYYASQPAP